MEGPEQRAPPEKLWNNWNEKNIEPVFLGLIHLESRQR